MSDGTKIEWTDASWPIVAGCEKVSPGCRGCWALLEWWKKAHHPNRKCSTPAAGIVKKVGSELAWTGVVRTLPERLMWPLRWRKARKIFVASQSDLFHPKVPFHFINQAFAVMGMCRRHTFQVLTKHPDRMLEYLSAPDRAAAIGGEQFSMAGVTPRMMVDGYTGLVHTRLPLENVWLGFSAENQEYFDARWPYMGHLARAGWMVWASLEPLLGPIDLTPALVHMGDPPMRWVVAGGESGPKARPSHPDWYRELRVQCAAAAIPFLFKQWGNWLPSGQEAANGALCENVFSCDEDAAPGCAHDWPDGSWSAHVRKGEAGRRLDGRLHTEFPT